MCDTARRKFIKDPNAVLDYGWNWSKWLGGDLLSEASFVSDTGLTIVQTGITEDFKTAVVWLAGGTDGHCYDVRCRILTAAGRVDDRTAHIQVEHL
jgi:hypothetical protein